MAPDFSTRSTRTELMDDPDCSEVLLLQTLRQFSSINRLVSRYRTVLKRWILADMMQDSERSYHLVDMGAGACDIDAWLLQTAGRLGLKLRVTACDLDPRTIGYARTTYGHIEGLTVRQTDLLADRFDEPVDYVFANHFLHHLPNEEIIRLLRLWQPRVDRRMVLSDLLRDPFAYAGFWFLSLVYRNSFARYDGLVSVQRAFKPHELEALAREALPEGIHAVHPMAPGRLVLRVEGNRKKSA